MHGEQGWTDYPNGQTSTYTYFAAAQDHRLQTIHNRYPDGATLSKYDYTYDVSGNILTWRQQADTSAAIWGYSYDSADQLDQCKGAQGQFSSGKYGIFNW